MITKSIPIINKLGFHARAAAKFVSAASRFGCKIEVSRQGKKANGKSIMGLMMLAANQGSTIEIGVDGEDEQEALHALEELINDRFGESE